MTIKTWQSIALSAFIHGLCLFILLSVSAPQKKQNIIPRPIQSYLFVDKPKVKAQQARLKSAVQQDNKAAVVKQLTLKDPSTAALESNEQPESLAARQPNNNKPTETQSKADAALQTIRAGVSRYFQNLHSDELQRLSQNALNAFNQPKPLVDNSKPLSTKQRLKALSHDFAPAGSDIIVVSTFGPNETNIIMGESCFTVKQTALSDKVWRGASVWKKTNACGNYDKFDGQLKKSLNKYLK